MTFSVVGKTIVDNEMGENKEALGTSRTQGCEHSMSTKGNRGDFLRKVRFKLRTRIFLPRGNSKPPVFHHLKLTPKAA